MSDLVERLKTLSELPAVETTRGKIGSFTDACGEASTALAKAQARIAKLEGAVMPFTKHQSLDDADMPDRCGVFCTLGDLRRARAALKGEG